MRKRQNGPQWPFGFTVTRKKGTPPPKNKNTKQQQQKRPNNMLWPGPLQTDSGTCPPSRLGKRQRKAVVNMLVESKQVGERTRHRLAASRKLGELYNPTTQIRILAKVVSPVLAGMVHRNKHPTLNTNSKDTPSLNKGVNPWPGL